MKRLLILTFAMLATLPAHAQDVAPITTYVPAVGDKLTFVAVTLGKDKDGQPSSTSESIESTISSISSDSKTVKLRESDSTATAWVSTPDIIKDNFLGLSTKQEIIVISNLRLLTTKVSDQRGTSLWFTLNKDGSSRFPEIVRVVRKGQTIFNLKAITRPKKKAKK